MTNSVGWFEIYVDDMQRARAFYERVFDVTLSPMTSSEMEMLIFPGDRASYGAQGALVKIPGFPTGANSVIVYFVCQDCAVEAAKAVAAGGSIQTEKRSIGPNGYIALVIDTEGNMIGLHSMQ